MKTYAIDFETYYDDECSITELGIMNYVRHPQFEAYLVSIIGDGFSWVGEPKEAPWELLHGQQLIAHNASFDRRFLDAELTRIGRDYTGEFACSMLAARRVYRDAPDHKLGTLVAWNGIPNNGTFHRALADAEMTAGLWLGMLRDITARHEFANIPFALMQELGRVPAATAADFLGREGERN